MWPGCGWKVAGGIKVEIYVQGDNKAKIRTSNEPLHLEFLLGPSANHFIAPQRG